MQLVIQYPTKQNSSVFTLLFRRVRHWQQPQPTKIFSKHIQFFGSSIYKQSANPLKFKISLLMLMKIILNIVFAVLTLGITLKHELHELAIISSLAKVVKVTSPCQDGETPYDNGGEISQNGCGSGSFQSKVSKFFGPYAHTFSPCCDTHDLCFGKCGGPDFQASFNKCNDDFKTCMYDICDSLAVQSKYYLRTTVQKTCNGNAWSFYEGVNQVGRLFYSKSQKVHCGCRSEQSSQINESEESQVSEQSEESQVSEQSEESQSNEQSEESLVSEQSE